MFNGLTDYYFPASVNIKKDYGKAIPLHLFEMLFLCLIVSGDRCSKALFQLVA